MGMVNFQGILFAVLDELLAPICELQYRIRSRTKSRISAAVISCCSLSLLVVPPDSALLLLFIISCSCSKNITLKIAWYSTFAREKACKSSNSPARCRYSAEISLRMIPITVRPTTLSAATKSRICIANMSGSGRLQLVMRILSDREICHAGAATVSKYPFFVSPTKGICHAD